MVKDVFERWNTHFSTVVEQNVIIQGVATPLRISQDPSSNNLGTTVWDASIVLTKFFEKNAVGRGNFSTAKLHHRQCLELGAGTGLAGIALALYGANVTFTDIQSVLPLLKKNVEDNILKSTAASAAGQSNIVGSVDIKELDWSNEATYTQFKPPYDYIIAADCVYGEAAVEPFLRTVLQMANKKTVVLIANEMRCQTVHSMFMDMFSEFFTVKKLPVSQLHSEYQHPMIHIYQCKLKRESSNSKRGRKGGGEGDDKGKEEAVR
jgi:predicted nicotinamide N-methyase